jgi:hypothetical protein
VLHGSKRKPGVHKFRKKEQDQEKANKPSFSRNPSETTCANVHHAASHLHSFVKPFASIWEHILVNESRKPLARRKPYKSILSMVYSKPPPFPTHRGWEDVIGVEGHDLILATGSGNFRWGGHENFYVPVAQHLPVKHHRCLCIFWGGKLDKRLPGGAPVRMDHQMHTAPANVQPLTNSLT